MLSRRCYRSRYLLACEPSARSELMARSVMNVAARAITASWYHKSRLPPAPRPCAGTALSYADTRAHMCVRYYQYSDAGRDVVGRRRFRRLLVCRE